LLEALQGGDAHGAAHVVVLRAVAGSVLHQIAAGHQAVAVDDQLGPGRPHEVVLPAHQDRLLRAGVHAEAAVDAAQEVDLEPGGVRVAVRVRARSSPLAAGYGDDARGPVTPRPEARASRAGLSSARGSARPWWPIAL